MGNLMTKEYVNQIQFFQMPKAFFQDSKYMPMKIEAKVFNPKRYIQSMIYNSVFEANIRVVGDIRREFGYCC